MDDQRHPEDPGWQAVPDWMGEGTASLDRAQSTPLPFEWAGDIEPVLDGLWLIEGWLPKSGVAALYGHPGSGKSFLALHMGEHVATGREWAGRHVEAGLVLYVVAEGQTGFRNRRWALMDENGDANEMPFAIVPTSIDLQAPNGDTVALIQTIRSAADTSNSEPALIVIDTLSKTFGAGKENTDDMAGYIANCQRIASAFNCLTLVVHHRPKDSESRDLRGHSSLRGGIDRAILVEGGEVKSATTVKQKDGPDNEQVRFKLERISLGEDKRGNQVSTCLVRVTDDEAAGARLAPTGRAKLALSGHNKTALRVLQEMSATGGKEPPMDIPADAIDRFKTWYAIEGGQAADRLQSEFIRLVEGDADKKADTARRTVRRALAHLKSKGILGSWGDWLWIN